VRASEKEVNLEVSGQETEIDKLVVERMMAPLLHLVRNAVSHGIETPTERQKAGKPTGGKIALRASTVGETVVVEIEDDGRGVRGQKVLEKAVERGLLQEKDRVSAEDYASILELLCSSGFSTREEADLTSGRGVGMAIVKNTVLELGGLLTLNTKPGLGTCFTIQLPLTLAIADALIVKVRDQIFAIPQSSVVEVMDISPEKITVLENNEIIFYRGNVLPILRLERLFKYNFQKLFEGGKNDESSRSNPSLDCQKKTGETDETSVRQKKPKKTISVAVVGNNLNGLNACGIVVEKFVGLREIVVRPLTDPLVRVPGITGATELGDGRVVLILDINTLIRKAAKNN
jgi:two-component system chemotaxis sensor kinase CheA